MKYLLTLAIVFFFSSSALAGIEIKQKIKSSIDQTKSESTHTWSIDGKKFHLSIESGLNKTTYFFNGHNFYICSKLDKKQLKFLIRNQLKNPKVLAKFAQGACQSVPANFMVRFFLSPTMAVESINRSDGMKLSLNLKDYSVKATPDRKKIKNYDCKNTTRNYRLIKKGTDNLKLENKLTETLCITDKIDWRTAFWRQVRMTVMRQPNVKNLLNPLKKDAKEIKGFILSGTNKVSFVDSKGKTHSGTRTIETISIQTKKPSKKLFATPIGYTIFSPETMALAAEDLNEKDSKTSKDSGTDTDEVTSMVLCALAGPLGCLFY